MKARGGMLRGMSCLLVTCVTGWTCGPPAGADGQLLPPAMMFGIEIGAVQLTDTGGTSVSLADRLAGAPGILMILDKESCLGCGDYATELKIVKREWPELSQLIVVDGPMDRELERFFRLRRLTPVTDPNDTLLPRLGQRRPPVVVVVDPVGTVLLLDARRGPGSTGFPISRVLAGLKAALSPDGEERASGGYGRRTSEREVDAIVSGIPGDS